MQQFTRGLTQTRVSYLSLLAKRYLHPDIVDIYWSPFLTQSHLSNLCFAIGCPTNSKQFFHPNTQCSLNQMSLLSNLLTSSISPNSSTALVSTVNMTDPGTMHTVDHIITSVLKSPISPSFVLTFQIVETERQNCFKIKHRLFIFYFQLNLIS